MKNKLWTKTWSKMKEKEGFTLIEMIIVVAIIAILITLITPNLQKFIETSNQTKTDATAKTMYTSIATYLVELTVSGATLPTEDNKPSYSREDINAWPNFKDEYMPEDLGDNVQITAVIEKGSVKSVKIDDGTYIATYPDIKTPDQP
ncbi:MAG: prepilin-type N-terminal cleavage/methylation domain-containing protein [Lachnospiraceae bacterium]